MNILRNFVKAIIKTLKPDHTQSYYSLLIIVVFIEQLRPIIERSYLIKIASIQEYLLILILTFSKAVSLLTVTLTAFLNYIPNSLTQVNSYQPAYITVIISQHLTIRRA